MENNDLYLKLLENWHNLCIENRQRLEEHLAEAKETEIRLWKALESYKKGLSFEEINKILNNE